MSYQQMCFPGFKRKALTFSYDDDVIFNKRLIEIFNKNGLKATFNINGGQFPKTDEDWLISEPTMVALLKNSKHEIANHGWKHESLSEVDSAAGINDIIEDRKHWEKVFGRIVKGYAYPCGTFAMDERSAQLAKDCGINYARTTTSTYGFDIPTDWLKLDPTCHSRDPRFPELCKTFVESSADDMPMMFYVWGHAYEFKLDDNWSLIEELAAYLGNRKDVWYATNGEIFDYVQAYDRLEYSVDKTRVFNPTCFDVYLRPFGCELTIAKAGKTTKIKKRKQV